MNTFECLGSARANNSTYRNLRSELYFMLRDRLPLLSLPHNKALREEMLSVKFLTISGRLCIEPKADLRKRGLTCDYLDSVSMLMYSTPEMAWVRHQDFAPDKVDRRSNEAIMDEFMKSGGCSPYRIRRF